MLIFKNIYLGGSVETITETKVSSTPPQPQPQQQQQQDIEITELEELTEVEALTLEYIKLYGLLEEVGGKALLYRMEALRKQLQSIANDQCSPDEPAVIKCPAGELEFTPRVLTTEVIEKISLFHFLVTKFGDEVAFSCIKFVMTDLKKVLSELELKNYVDTKPGSRTLKYVRPKPTT